jgi:hypothetical protein
MCNAPFWVEKRELIGENKPYLGIAAIIYNEVIL